MINIVKELNTDTKTKAKVGAEYTAEIKTTKRIR